MITEEIIQKILDICVKCAIVYGVYLIVSIILIIVALYFAWRYWFKNEKR